MVSPPSRRALTASAIAAVAVTVMVSSQAVQARTTARAGAAAAGRAGAAAAGRAGATAGGRARAAAAGRAGAAAAGRAGATAGGRARAAAGATAEGRAVGGAGAAAAAAAARTRPAYCGHGGPRLWANLAACGWPGPASTGPDLRHCPGHRLVPRGVNPDGAIVIRKRGTVLRCEQILGRLQVEARDVLIQDSTVRSHNPGRPTGDDLWDATAAILVNQGASATVNRVTINGGNGVHACIWDEGNPLTARALNCYGVVDGVFSWAESGAPTSGDNFTITGSYFHDFNPIRGLHEDGYQTEGASRGLIAHNTYRMSAAVNSAIAIWDGRRPASDITVAGNLVTGGGFAIYAEDYSPGTGAPGQPSAAGGFSVTGVRFTGNDFSTHAAGCVGHWGVWFTRPTWRPYQGGPTGGWLRRGNRVLETGERIDTHNPHNHGVLCR
jgi:hypothetical protein